jgi:hypothetical protein
MSYQLAYIANGIHVAWRLSTKLLRRLAAGDIQPTHDASCAAVLSAQVNRELPPGLSLEGDAEWIVDDKKDKDG